MTDGRKDDVAIAALNQKVDDLIDQFKQERVDSKAWRTKFEDSLAIVQKTMNPLLQAHNIGFWVAVTIFGAFLVATGTFVFSWLQKHFN